MSTCWKAPSLRDTCREMPESSRSTTPTGTRSTEPVFIKSMRNQAQSKGMMTMSKMYMGRRTICTQPRTSEFLM